MGLKNTILGGNRLQADSWRQKKGAKPERTQNGAEIKRKKRSKCLFDGEVNNLDVNFLLTGGSCATPRRSVVWWGGSQRCLGSWLSEETSAALGCHSLSLCRLCCRHRAKKTDVIEGAEYTFSWGHTDITTDVFTASSLPQSEAVSLGPNWNQSLYVCVCVCKCRVENNHSEALSCLG